MVGLSGAQQQFQLTAVINVTGTHKGDWQRDLSSPN